MASDLASFGWAGTAWCCISPGRSHAFGSSQLQRPSDATEGLGSRRWSCRPSVGHRAETWWSPSHSLWKETRKAGCPGSIAAFGLHQPHQSTPCLQLSQKWFGSPEWSWFHVLQDVLSSLHSRRHFIYWHWWTSVIVAEECLAVGCGFSVGFELWRCRHCSWPQDSETPMASEVQLWWLGRWAWWSRSWTPQSMLWCPHGLWWCTIRGPGVASTNLWGSGQTESHFNIF